MGLAKSKECKVALMNWIPERNEPFIGEQRAKVASLPEKGWVAALGMCGMP